MRKIRVAMMVIMGCVSFTAWAGDTNFVAQFDAIWQTHNATNILVFVEDNVATNVSAEVLFARGNVAIELQDWGVGATNYWEQSIQMISTNSAYSEIGRTNVINKIQFFRGMLAKAIEIEGLDTPSWKPKVHALAFSLSKTPDLELLKAIATLPPAED